MHFKQTKDKKRLFFNQKIKFGCIHINKNFMDIENQS
jgi:hypothetical protein